MLPADKRVGYLQSPHLAGTNTSPEGLDCHVRSRRRLGLLRAEPQLTLHHHQNCQSGNTHILLCWIGEMRWKTLTDLDSRSKNNVVRSLR
jgi:hypothetical protein